METESKGKNFLKEHKMSIFVIVSAVVMLIGLSYAWLQLTLRGTKELTLIAAGTLYLELDDTMEGGIAITSAVPVSDEEGKRQEGYTFKLENKGQVNSDYTIYLDDLDLLEDQSRMPDSAIKYQLIRDGKEIGFGLIDSTGENPNRILDMGNILSGKKYTYILRMWIDYDAGNEVMGTIFKGQLRIEAIQSTKKTAVQSLLKKTNPTTLTYDNATEEEKKEMFTFSHEAGEQQIGWSEEELTDYRYIGKKPNNYVTFNDEVWRIIGVFTVEDDVGNKEKRLKLIREESIGNYSWDNKGSHGENDWSKSTLQQVLNSGAYDNRTSGECPSGNNNGTTLCDFTNNGLTDTAKNMIVKTKWYLGGWSSSILTASQFYTYERGIKIYSDRPIDWLGKVGLIYSSDYGYAAGSSECLNKDLAQYSSCTSHNWLYKASAFWTLTPASSSSNILYAFDQAGNLYSLPASDTNARINPVVFLSSSLSISSGDGSEENPYTLKNI